MDCLKNHAGQPRGRDQVRAALLEAATRLFAARGPAAVSVREIAAAAGVNHGLIHRHFGSKKALLGAVLERLASNLPRATAIDEAKPNGVLTQADTTSVRDTYLRTLARAILDKEVSDKADVGFPDAEHLATTLLALGDSKRQASTSDTRIAAAQTLALALGWLLFEPFIVEATGLPAASERNGRGAR